MCLVQNGKIETLRPLMKVGSASSEIEVEERDVWICFMFAVSYCCGIPDGKYMSCVEQSIAVARLWARCAVTLEDIRYLQEVNNQELRQTKHSREQCAGLVTQAKNLDKMVVYRMKQDLVCAEKDRLFVLSLSNCEQFWHYAGFKKPGMFSEMYAVVTFELLHNPHFKI